MDDDRVVWMDDLATEVCWQLLEGRQIGRVAFVDDRGPMVLPVNFRLDGRSIVVRTARGSILEAIGSGVPVTFEVDGTDAYTESGWSVIARGVASEETDPAAAVAGLDLHPWAPGPKDHWIRIEPSSVTGRAISRRRSEDDGRLLPYMPAD